MPGRDQGKDQEEMSPHPNPDPYCFGRTPGGAELLHRNRGRGSGGTWPGNVVMDLLRGRVSNNDRTSGGMYLDRVRRRPGARSLLARRTNAANASATCLASLSLRRAPSAM